MFNNSKLIKSKGGSVPTTITRVVELLTGYGIVFNGTRLLVSGYYDDLTNNGARRMQSIDSNFNVASHNPTSNYQFTIICEIDGNIFSQAGLDLPTTDSGYSVHRWDSSYNYIGDHDISSNSFACGLLKSDSYFWGILVDIIGHSYLFCYSPTSITPLATNTFLSRRFVGMTNGGLACYNNSKLYVTIYTGFNYEPCCMSISGTIADSYQYLPVSEVSNESWYCAGVANGKAVYFTAYGNIAVFDCATNNYTFISSIASVLGIYGSVVGDYVYFSQQIAQSYIYRLDTRDNSVQQIPKPSNSYIWGFCEGFDGKTFCIERDNATKQHYLSVLE